MSCGKPKKEAQVNATTEQSAQETKQPEQVDQDKQQKDVAIITTDFGDMVVEFFEGVAPKHVESFKLHAQNGYYNGTLFHRVIPGFMIQGGDPNTKTDNKASYGTGGHAAKYFGIGSLDEKKTWKVPAEFNTIKHKKGAADAKRGQLFTKLSREIMIAAKQGDPNPDLNFRLRLAVDNAKSLNMPKDNIARSISKGSCVGRD